MTGDAGLGMPKEPAAESPAVEVPSLPAATGVASGSAPDGASTAEASGPDKVEEKLNWLRAGVLGANDGIISTAGLIFGVAGATSNSYAILIAGLAGLVAGALSMAGGEYVSVSSQRDT
ncbi:MAG: VIT1/CCC1 transporter family protein, partial [Propionibacteriaceae bacterium]|nr:VIT1/CCC1 transporter family protein [Propionibacteriaceae bacterium]